MKQRRIHFFAYILEAVLISLFLFSCKKKKIFFTLTYESTSGGTIYGNKNQLIEHNNNGTKVIAIADEGYIFIRWSDNLTTPTRIDESITNDMKLTAIFEKQNLLTYTYRCDEGGYIIGNTSQTAEINCDLEEVTAVAYEGYRFIKWSDEII